MQDELDEIKVEKDNLAKKANTVDKYKQKLQASQNLEKENQRLHSELDDLRDSYQNADQSRQQIAGLQLAVEEYKRILPKIEQDRHELQMMKRQLEFDNATLAQRCEAANELHLKDQELMADLMGKTSNAKASGDVLDAELEEQESMESMQVISRHILKADYSNRPQGIQIKKQKPAAFESIRGCKCQMRLARAPTRRRYYAACGTREEVPR